MTDNNFISTASDDQVCPRCGSSEVYDHPEVMNQPKYGQGVFYCESCDKKHEHPIKFGEKK